MTHFVFAFGVMSPPSSVVYLDRRVKFDHVHNDAPAIERISQLAGFRFVVLLSEPGMGKSTTLEQQALAVGGHFTDVRWFIEGGEVVPTGVSLFLDGLDEYRSDSASAVEKLTRRLLASEASGWWLSCRAVDWRASDLAVLQKATDGANVVVATMMPLETEETDQLISSLSEESVASVRARAHAFGARAFLQNPLSLSLLVTANQENSPQSRFDLFDGATQQLVHEFDKRRPVDVKRVPKEILAIASRLCALLLLSNRSAIWHQNRPAPRDGNSERYLPSNTLGTSSKLLELTLDTVLFRRIREGVYVPMHRAVAEFLAGRALATAAAGSTNQPKLPLGRILALMTAGGRPPSDLRGTFAWTAVHLSRNKERAAASRMICQDPVSVLVYGDAAALSLDQRAELWHRLDLDDPWFLANHEGDTAIGGLAGSDLAGEFEEVLRKPNAASHRFFAVVEAMQYGKPIAELRPLLHEIALDENRLDHERERAAEAWLAAEPDVDEARLGLFRACSILPASDAHVLFRLRMAGELSSDALTDEEIDQLLVDYARTKEGNISGRLWKLTRKLQQSMRPALLNRAWHLVLQHNTVRGPTHEVKRLLDQVLVTVLTSSSAWRAQTVLTWLTNLRPYYMQPIPDGLRNALREWMNADLQRSLEVMDAVARANATRPRQWLPEYFGRFHALPSMETVTALLDPASRICCQIGAAECRSLAVDIALQHNAASAIRPTVLEQLKLLPQTDEIVTAIDHLENGQPKHQAFIEMEMREEAFRAQQARRVMRVVAKFQRCAAALSDGSAIALLRLAAQYRFGTNIHQETIAPSFYRVTELVGNDLAKAIETGWLAVAKNLKVAADEVGRMDALLQLHPVEDIVLAAIDRLLVTAPEAAQGLPVSAALMVLKSSHANAYTEEAVERRFDNWALEHLDRAGQNGVEALSKFWRASLDSSAIATPSGAWAISEAPKRGRFARSAIEDALRYKPEMGANALEGMLNAAVGIVSSFKLLFFATRALENTAVTGTSRELWMCVAFSLNPNAYHDGFVEMFQNRATALSEYSSLMGGLVEEMPAQRVLVAKGILEVCFRGERREDRRGESLARASLELLQNSLFPLARVALESLAEDPQIEDPLRDDIRHAMAVQGRKWREGAFTPPSPAAIEEVLSSGAPANAGDLFAVMVEQLRLIQYELQTGPLDGWDSYWNEKPRTPKTENRCRNALARELQARVRHFGIDVPLAPEAQRAAETRADLLVISNQGMNLPLEAKRHWHPHVWTAAATQLQGYTADIGAERFGLYVVFWFGQYKPVPSRSDKRRPRNAAEMEEMLVTDLPESLRAKTEVVVLDVSNPRAGKPNAAKGKSKAKSR